VAFCFSAQSHPAIASRMFAGNRLQFDYIVSTIKLCSSGMRQKGSRI
jgi:hypothetical protein